MGRSCAVGGTDEGDAIATACCLKAQGDGQVCFPRPDGSGYEDVAGPFDKATGGQLSDLGPADAPQGIPVDLVEALEVREVGLAHAALGNAGLAGQHLRLQELVEELLVDPALVGCLPGEGRILPQNRWQLELAAVTRDDGATCCVTHDLPPSSSAS
jgi:hypothetical protein